MILTCNSLGRGRIDVERGFHRVSYIVFYEYGFRREVNPDGGAKALFVVEARVWISCLILKIAGYLMVRSP